jgi:hypothetical protein
MKRNKRFMTMLLADARRVLTDVLSLVLTRTTGRRGRKGEAIDLRTFFSSVGRATTRSRTVSLGQSSFVHSLGSEKGRLWLEGEDQFDSGSFQ